jgi:hypothetical protein
LISTGGQADRPAAAADAHVQGSTMKPHVPQVGAPDPEKRTSPILDEDEESESSFDFDRETGVCHFNGQSFPLGSYVLSGSDLLHCEERGVWVRKYPED